MEDLIPAKLLRKLALICSTYEGSSSSLQALADQVALAVGTSEENVAMPSVDGLSSEESRDFFNIILCVFITAAQNNYQVDKFKSFFLDIGAKQQVVDILSRAYQTHRTSLRKLLSSIGNDSLVLCDASWRLDYITKDNELDDLGELRYAVSLVVQHRNDKFGSTRELVFFCSMEQLQDLVSKLKLALSSVDRLASSASGVSSRP